MAHGRARDEQKEQQWGRCLDQWRASGLSVRDFCARRGLATPSFYHRRPVLQRRAAADGTNGPTGPWASNPWRLARSLENPF